jgi:hypothetical protein
MFTETCNHEAPVRFVSIIWTRFPARSTVGLFTSDARHSENVYFSKGLMTASFSCSRDLRSRTSETMRRFRPEFDLGDGLVGLFDASAGSYYAGASLTAESNRATIPLVPPRTTATLPSRANRETDMIVVEPFVSQMQEHHLFLLL